MYMTIGEAAHRVGVHPSTVRRWIRWGKMPRVARDRNGWRLFSEREMELLKRLARSRDGQN